MRKFFLRLAELLETHPSLVVATVVRVAGSCPRDVGARLIVFADGGTEDTLGGGALEARAVEDALGFLSRRTPGLARYRLSGDDLGMKCGGEAELYFDPVFPEDRLVIFGGGHVGRALAREAAGVGFAVEVVDDRGDALQPSDYPPGTALVATDAAFATGFEPPGPTDFVAILTRNAETDGELAGRYGADCAYVGVMGSAAKMAFIRKTLRDRGVTDDAIDRIHCPMGVEIGSDTPAEVAVSMVADLIRVRAARRRSEAPAR